MSATTRLIGREAIDYAEQHGLTLKKYTDPTEEAREGLTVAEANAVVGEDPSLIYIDCPFYRVRRVTLDPHVEEFRDYEASSLGEALAMAERDDAGREDAIYGICPEDYATAQDEGIEFNEADGLLI